MSLRFTQEWLDDYNKRQGKNPEIKPVTLAEKEPKKSKYRNNIVYIDGMMFRSQKEANRYCEIKLKIRAGEAWAVVCQPKFVLIEGNEKQKPITYSADFLVIYPGMICEVEDTKGYENEQWKRTYKMFKAKYPDIELRVI